MAFVRGRRAEGVRVELRDRRRDPRASRTVGAGAGSRAPGAYRRRGEPWSRLAEAPRRRGPGALGGLPRLAGGKKRISRALRLRDVRAASRGRVRPRCSRPGVDQRASRRNARAARGRGFRQKGVGRQALVPGRHALPRAAVDDRRDHARLLQRIDPRKGPRGAVARARTRARRPGIRARGKRAGCGSGRRSAVCVAGRDMSARARSGALTALRGDVALANIVIERFGLSNAFGHASARIPGTETFLMPTRRSPGLASAATLLVVDTEGKVLSGRGTPNSELWIHARVYAARPDVGGVVHAHPPACVCLTQIGQPHRVVHNQGGAFERGVTEYERIGLIRTRELGDLLAHKLGAGIAVMMRGHGITTALSDVRAATVAACLLEESSQLQLDMLAAAGGDASRLRAYTREEAEGMSDQLSPRVVARAWEYYAAVAQKRPLGA